jgi:uncharacterized membrane protein YgdD (TMEM256/DUF423 family)
MAGLGVAFGAFGAHALRARLDAEDLAIFEIGVRYQMYHAFAVIACGLVALRIDNAAVKAAAPRQSLGASPAFNYLWFISDFGKRQRPA